MLDSFNLDAFFSNIYADTMTNIELYAPKFIWALAIIIFGTLLSIWVYKLTLYIYRKFNVEKLVDTIESNLEVKEIETKEDGTPLKRRSIRRKKLTDRVQLDILLAKSFSYYVFLIFFRFSVVAIGINDVEKFLADLISYLPNLFIWVMIWFFWMRFSDTVHDVIYHTMEFTKQKAWRVIAMGGKIVILFFTLMLVLNYLKIVDQLIINTFIIGFVATVTLGFWLAFWLGGKDLAKEILESFKK